MEDSSSTELKAEALVILKYCNNNLEKAAELLDVDVEMLEHWRNEFQNTGDDSFVTIDTEVENEILKKFTG